MDSLVEEIVEEQVLEIGIAAVCVCDVLQEYGSDDTATTPHESDRWLVELPLVLFCSLQDNQLSEPSRIKICIPLA